MEHEANEQWYTLENIELDDQKACEKLYCLAVDSPEKQFLIGEIAVPTHNTDEGKEEDRLKGEAQMILGSIARLGRAAGVHMVVATQRPDATIISGETKANLGVRIACGRTLGNASSMILDNGEGNRIRSSPKGRLYVKIFGDGDHAQGFFQDHSWIDEWLAAQGRNPDGSPIAGFERKMVAPKPVETDDSSDSVEGADSIDSLESIEDFEGVHDLVSVDDSEGSSDDIRLSSVLDDDFEEEEDWRVDDDLEPATESEPVQDGTRPQLTGGKTTKKPWERPEDDWDAELEALIEENFDK